VGRSIGGARALALIDGKEVGYATGVSATETITQIPVEALGDAYVKEHEPVAVVVTATLDSVRLSLASLREQGVWPRGDTADLIAFQETPLTLIVFDDIEDRPIWKVEGLVPETLTWRIDRGSLMTTNATFRGRRMFDEYDA